MELDDLELASGVVKVVVDRPGGVDLDTISDLTYRISALLDEHDPFPGRYTLEVSSPGLERRLRTPSPLPPGRRHRRWRCAPWPAPRAIAGSRARSTAADDDGVVVDGRRLAYADIERAHTVFEWGPPPKPGKVGARKKSQKEEA